MSDGSKVYNVRVSAVVQVKDTRATYSCTDAEG